MAKYRLNVVRLAFPQLWKAEAPKGGGEKAFSANFILKPTHKQIDDIKKQMFACAKAKWGAKAKGIYSAMEKRDKLALHDGDTKEEYEGFPGNLFISARNKRRPSVFDGAKNPVDEESGEVYSGCYVNAVIEFWAQDNDYGKRINAQLLGVQFVKDGEAFAGGAAPADEDDFDEIESDDEDEEDEDVDDDEDEEDEDDDPPPRKKKSVKKPLKKKRLHLADDEDDDLM